MAEYEACILGLRSAIDINVQELLVIRDSDLLVYQVLGEWAIKNTKILPYLHCIQKLIKRFTKIEFKHVPRVQNEFADALAALSSMIKHPDKNFIDHVLIGIHKQPAYCAHVEEESDGNPWFHNIKEYLAKGEYPEHYTHTQKRMLQRLANHFFQSRGILYRRTPDLGLLRQENTKSRVFLDDYGNRLHQAANEWSCRGHQQEHQEALRKMVDNYKQWHEKLPYALLGYRTMVRTSTRATPYLLVYGTEAVIPAEVEIPSLRIIQEAELSDAEWVQRRYE
ncbi:uncharacterized protein [Nicotiana tomentosiformis]|uniref:uncharacterized protein n=1 Tax=Nicotiana tomentosiformis TaxID=4098 RepID=UPI00388CE889